VICRIVNWNKRKGAALNLKQVFRNLLAFFMLAIFLLAGCQGQDILESVFLQDQPNTAKNIETPVPTAANLPRAAASPTHSGFYELVIWVPPQFDPNLETKAGKLLSARILDFLQENPAVNLNVRVKAASGTGNILESLTNTEEVAPSALPSLALLTRPDMVQAAEKNLLYPIEEISTAIDESDWYEFAREMGIHSGIVYGLPFASNILGLVHRNQGFNPQAILWEDLIRLFDSIVFPAGDPDAIFTLASYFSAGAQQESDPTMHQFDLDLFQKVLVAYSAGVKYGAIPAAISEMQTDEQIWEFFQQTNSTAVITWVSRLLSEEKNLSLAPLPSIDGNSHTIANGWVWCLTEPEEKNHAYAIKLAEYLTEAEFLKDWVQSSGYLPVHPSSMENWEDQPTKKLLERMLLSAILIPDQSELDLITGDLKTAVIDIILKQTSPDEASERIRVKMEASATQ